MRCASSSTVRPNRWTEDDASSVRLMIANQRRTIAEMHPKDIKGKESAKAVLVELETALQRYLEEQVRRS